jgi:ABC-type nitrate/sulfonate/bicarbonate transport system permease component
MADRSATSRVRAPDAGDLPPTAPPEAVREVFDRAHREHLARQRRESLGVRLRRGSSIVFALAAWAVLSLVNERVEMVNPILLPSPLEVLLAGYDLWEQGLLLRDITTSMVRVFEGFAIAVVAGIVLGGISGWNRWAGNFIEPLIELLRPIPPLAFLPLFVMWLGLGESSKVLFIAFVAFFTVYLNTLDAVRNIEPVYIRAAQSLGARGAQMYFRVVFPAALPQIVTGVRLGFGMAFFALIAAELIAAASGLGYRIQDARNFFRVDIMLFAAATIGVIGFTINYLLRALERRALQWQPRREQD